MPSGDPRQACRHLVTQAGYAPLALDVIVAHPLRPSANLATVATAGIEAEGLEKAKNIQYAGPCKDAGWRFHPLGFETTGGLGPHCRRFLRQLTNHLSMRSGERPANVSQLVSLRLSVALAKGRAHMLLAAKPEGRHDDLCSGAGCPQDSTAHHQDETMGQGPFMGPLQRPD